MHLVNNEGWGVNAGENDNRWNDARFVACVFYYNRQGNVWFGGTGTSGAVEFIGCRSERAGNKHLDTANPVNADAPGWRFNRGVRINLVACSTDANTGNGVEIAALNSSQASDLYSIQIAGCAFGRDGTGNNIALPAAAGIKLKGFSSLGSDSVQYAKVVGCSVTTGKSSDNGTGTIIGPKYGIWCENAQFFDLLANRFEGSTQDIYFAGNIYKPNVQDMRDKLFSVPESGSRPTTSLQRGMMMWDTSMSKPIWYDGTNWRDANGTLV